ncbi:hydrogenase maturation nickel metallochaperone HypA [Shimwellia blattae]|uniref:Hydrogenase maturation factor HypA n=1 Tax=Shimwellia blattae (strain ATCC 29907 / DSM 4481 / JCM 1650 / NBRC 105725 / CDC 9005-74) TaxID=630626 RepID=I2B8S6_SHIBC|nr:hydrogenase maturation nickel metallochaperone HypA [Shimwellia blattae]AFJ46930.1 hydrogenase nickel incorporation protein HypA family [Shimwellia blattae DSM 4481 = NBRC 105725]GAB82409.1 putative hydrogenase nickel incorporation protein HypA [Shimwellia blattae DSM 4481 = NBRC 105725]VDY64419.1 hydrogenase nickel incorporation protein HybF [Shimwellia blattae]VEC22532.1 hydrogenase nickel incorporation protein HybF [Shimwellia blattae]
MHELSLAFSVVELLEEQSKSQTFKRVTDVWIDIGALACIEPQALESGLRSASQGTLAQGARFHLRTQPASAWCFECQQPFSTPHHRGDCPRCGSHQIQVAKGDEMRLKEIAVE